jgi:hypothetical protein
MSWAVLEPPLHPGQQLKRLGNMSTHDDHQSARASNWRRAGTIFILESRTTEPEKRTQAGIPMAIDMTNACSFILVLPELEATCDISGHPDPILASLDLEPDFRHIRQTGKPS